MTSRFIRVGLLGAVMAFGLAAPRVISAQAPTTFTNHLYDKLQLNFDLTTVLNRSQARVDGGDGSSGTNVDFKDILGISGTSLQPALGLAWKPGKRTEFSVGYQFINQTGDRLLDKQIVIGDDSIDADFNVKSKIGSSNATFQFRYSIFAAPKHNIGLAIGFGGVFLDMQLDATANGCTGTQCQSGAVNIAKKLTGPTASLGAFGRWRVGDSWYVGGDLRGVGATVDRFDLSVLEAAAFGRYFLSNRWGLEAGWNYTDVTIDVAPKDAATASDVSGRIKYGYSSLKVGVVAAF